LQFRSTKQRDKIPLNGSVVVVDCVGVVPEADGSFPDDQVLHLSLERRVLDGFLDVERVGVAADKQLGQILVQVQNRMRARQRFFLLVLELSALGSLFSDGQLGALSGSESLLHKSLAS